ncbi:unnamed protein product [Caenorhabditis bovis]|uniref:Uncharacterized protein n=1 Tax=Caenorhabditis bovis TaxID=2654633 RepID=A0A8S1EMJ9_9PELO|nr:unnamed protein product [Caenorhabditis bovis]
MNSSGEIIANTPDAFYRFAMQNVAPRNISHDELNYNSNYENEQNIPIGLPDTNVPYRGVPFGVPREFYDRFDRLFGTDPQFVGTLDFPPLLTPLQPLALSMNSETLENDERNLSEDQSPQSSPSQVDVHNEDN